MSTPEPSSPAEPFTLPARDGFPLAATRYPAQGPVQGLILVACATGVPQGFYRRFASFASAQGYTVLTLDYRGIGLSRPASLRGFEADFLDWARLDLAAAVDLLGREDLPLFLVGHSFGGQALGLLPNHARVAAMHTFGTGAGWHGWMPRAEGLRVRALWAVAAPVIAGTKGYLAWSLLRMGEDLPLGVYRQWRRWCAYPRFFFDDPAMADVAAGFSAVRTPIVAVNASDDPWATPRSRDAFMPGYRHSDWQAVDIAPHALGSEPIGHMGYFRAHAQPLWQQALDRFRAIGRGGSR